ncbi:MAG: hypothetical protein J0H68_09100 [Sphingobacteriia bacterium]|nr:hypothetical protein [Sphingobacteriia bacterium]
MPLNNSTSSHTTSLIYNELNFLRNLNIYVPHVNFPDMQIVHEISHYNKLMNKFSDRLSNLLGNIIYELRLHDIEYLCNNIYTLENLAKLKLQINHIFKVDHGFDFKTNLLINFQKIKVLIKKFHQVKMLCLFFGNNKINDIFINWEIKPIIFLLKHYRQAKWLKLSSDINIFDFYNKEIFYSLLENSPFALTLIRDFGFTNYDFESLSTSKFNIFSNEIVRLSRIKNLFNAITPGQLNEFTDSEWKNIFMNYGNFNSPEFNLLFKIAPKYIKDRLDFLIKYETKIIENGFDNKFLSKMFIDYSTNEYQLSYLFTYLSKLRVLISENELENQFTSTYINFFKPENIEISKVLINNFDLFPNLQKKLTINEIFDRENYKIITEALYSFRKEKKEATPLYSLDENCIRNKVDQKNNIKEKTR